MTDRHAWPEIAHIQQAGEGFRIHWHTQPSDGPADGRTPANVDSAPPGPAETPTGPQGDWDKKEPIINCRDAMLLGAIGVFA